MIHPYALAARAAHQLLRRALAYCLLLLVLLLAVAGVAQAQTATTYSYTGGTDSYVVPAGVTQLTVVATGANNGAVVQATVAVIPGETLTVVVGGGGSSAFFGPGGGSSGPSVLVGYNGGGNSGFYNLSSGTSISVGGGATDLRRNGARTNDYLASRNALLVAGGGGSGCATDRGDYYAGGSGGTPTGGDGSGAGVGGGASQAGVGSSAGGAASNNVGGTGTNYGGSGGGGYYGGGSGTSSGSGRSFIAGGGGGGSSWIATGSTGTFGLSTDYDGSMTITPIITATPALTAPANGSTVATATPTYSGTATAGSTVRLYVDGSSTALTTTATSGGTFSVVQPTALGQGSHSVYATAQSSGVPVSARSATVTFTVDTVAPTATLSTTASNPTATSPIPFTVTFSEPVTGFGAGGLVVSNGTLTGGTVSGTSGGTTYTFTVTPSGNGVVVGVSVRAGAAQDAAGNGNPASGTTSVTYSVTPTISGFSPPSGPIGQTVTVTGTNLTGATAVTVNGTAGTITGTPTTGSLTFTVGAGSTTGLIRVTTPGGTATSSTSFAVVPAPTISGFSPPGGPVGQTVTITGTNFTGATGVTLNGAAIPGFTVVNSTTVTFVVPAGSSSGLIAVTTPGGTATSSGAFTFIPPPTISGFSPGSANTGRTVTVTGINFNGATALTLNGVAITGFTVVNGTTITFAVPAGATSGPIGVTTPGGTATSSGSLTIDNTAPTATLSTTAGGSTGVSPIPFTVTFSEGVTGLAAGGLVVSNGTLTGGTVSGTSGGTTYTFTVTPTGSGSVVTVRVAAGAAQDAASNASLASNTVSVTYNGPPPGAEIVNTGTLLTVQAGGILYVGPGGLGNQAGTLTNGGTLRVDGPLTNPGTLDLGAGTLEVKGDLNNAGTVTPGTSAVTFSGAADQLLTPGGASLYRVVVNKATAGANTLRLAGNLTVTNNLNLLSGLVNTKNGTVVSTLSLPNGATLSGEASGRYVLGSLQVTRSAVSGAAVDFGHGAVLNPTTNNLGTVAITRTAGLLTDDVSRGVNFTNTAYKGIDRIYTVSPATQPAANAPVQLTLSWLPDNDNGITNFTQARVWQQSASGQPWAVRSPVANASSRSISMSPTSLSRFTVSNAANPLPVTLVDFTALADGPAAVRLRWTTASELNNAGFTVERSPDGTAFEAIGTVAGAGTSATRHDYALLDAKLPGGATLLYYRLRQTDQSGEFSYSPVRTVQLTSSPTHQFAVFPTRVAAGQAATYRYIGPAEAGTLDILSVLGQVLGTVALDGRPTGAVPLPGLATGVYFLRYTGPAGRFTSRLVVE
ncbi:hypothetical protein GCM10028824_09770 [Hymenobacter segetis]|uniref:receptor protein-tyrosine kinase n=1 Tax=Hymenobacter segetis TaxID=2025509 RepID=A0ABU9LV11_9BACT